MMNNTQSLSLLPASAVLCPGLTFLLPFSLLLFLLEPPSSSHLFLLLQPLLLLQCPDDLQLSLSLNLIGLLLRLLFFLLELHQLLDLYFIIRLPQEIKGDEGDNGDDHVSLEAIPKCPKVGPVIHLRKILGINLRRSIHDVVVDVLREEIASKESDDHQFG